MSELTPEALDTIEAEDHAYNCVSLDMDETCVVISFHPEQCDCFVVELRRLRTENTAGWRTTALRALDERDALQAKIAAAPHGSDCPAPPRWPDFKPVTCNCWKSAGLAGEA